MNINFRKMVPALTMVALLAGSLLAYNFFTGNYGLTPDRQEAVQDGALGENSEDMVAPLLNQFQLKDRHYILLSDDLRSEYGFPNEIKDEHIGQKLADIAKSSDSSLIGMEVYEYKPAGGEAVVAVKKNDEYLLFKFFTFESYNNNQDEDAIEYLKLYGINAAADIGRVQFIGYSERSKLEGKLDILGEIKNSDDLARFYEYYSALKNSSDEYFEALFGYRPGDYSVEVDLGDESKPDVAPDYKDETVEWRNPDAPDQSDAVEDLPLPLPQDGETGVNASDTPLVVDPSGAMMDMGDGETSVSGESSGQVAPSAGTAGDALANPIGIRIYNQNGVYYETMYYKKIGFISRYEISRDFAQFLEGYINQ